MNSQLYIATSGLLVEQRRLDLISQNLANMASGAFRPQHLYTTSFAHALEGADATLASANTSVAVAGTYESLIRGTIEPTQRPLDVALAETDYVRVETPTGPRYTRVGSFDLAEGGRLTTSSGHALVDRDGEPISGLTEPAIAADGRVLNAGVEVSRLAIYSDPEHVLSREGDGLFTADGRDAQLVAVEAPELDPGWLEASGVDPLGEMVSLIESQRAFETYQKLITLTMNEVTRRAVNDIAG